MDVFLTSVTLWSQCKLQVGAILYLNQFNTILILYQSFIYLFLLYISESEIELILLTSCISWVWSCINMLCMFVGVFGRWVIYCSIKKQFLPCSCMKVILFKMWSNWVSIDINNYDISCNYNTQYQYEWLTYITGGKEKKKCILFSQKPLDLAKILLKCFKPTIWKTGSTTSVCIGCSNNKTAANSRLSAWGFKLIKIYNYSKGNIWKSAN